MVTMKKAASSAITWCEKTEIAQFGDGRFGSIARP
jgi:hypothetical protein